ncbi:DinB family protein [Streptomyces sp. NPDC091271]|uniref:DinB family protein n=1 Tax=Streptomyces sp. NPDC091271 TaxID=3365980 RepID=UPI003830D501
MCGPETHSGGAGGSTTIAHCPGRQPQDRAEVAWPGDAGRTISRLRELRKEWLVVLEGLDDTELDAVAPLRWADDPEHTGAHTVAWVNTELMKNAAEIAGSGSCAPCPPAELSSAPVARHRLSALRASADGS